MNKIKRIFFIVAIMAVAICCFTACGDEDQLVTGTMTLVIGAETPVTYTVDLDNIEINEGVLSVLQYLSETKDLEYVAERSVYGAYLTKVGSLEQNLISGTYIYIYTSVEHDFDVSAYAVSVQYEGKTLMSSGLGISEMTIKKDCVIYISLVTF